MALSREKNPPLSDLIVESGLSQRSKAQHRNTWCSQ